MITWKEATPIRLSLSLDDGGAEATGRYQGNAALSLDNLLTFNDLFSLSVGKNLFQDQPFGSRNRALYYSLPFGYWQLAVAYNDYRYDQTIAGINQSYVYRGDSENSQLTLSRVLHRNHAHKTQLILRAYQRKSRNFINDTEIQIQHRQTAGWELGLGHRAYLGLATLDANLNWRHGTGMLGAQTAPEDALGEGSSRPSIVLWDLNLNLPFTWLEQRWHYTTQLRGQWSQDPLVPQDRFAIGDRYTVRGFDGEFSLSGERGWLWRNELAWFLGSSGQALYVGLDQGQVMGPASTNLLGTQLTGGVLGLRGTFARQLSYDVFIGWPIQKPAGFKTATTAAGFNLNWQY